MSSWFGGVPDAVEICGRAFVTAGQAIDVGAPGGADLPPENDGERPTDDWSAVAVLKMARLQLDEMASVIGMALDAQVSGWSVDEIASALQARARKTVGVDHDDLLYELGAIREGLELRAALTEDLRVNHGFAVDGSISITIGPDIPESATIGLEGSTSGEMNDQPDDIFRLAVSLTEEAGRLYWALNEPGPKASTGDAAVTPAAESSSFSTAAASTEKGSFGEGRKASGSPVFVAASAIDQRLPEITFEQALALARLVLIHGGGPVPIRGKRAVMDSSTVKHLARLGLVQQAQEGSVEAAYQVKSTSTGGAWTPHVEVVGSRDRARWLVFATEEGHDLVRSAAVDMKVDTPAAQAPAGSPAMPDHAPLDRRAFGQLELDLKRQDPNRDEVARAVRGLIQEAMTYRDGPEVLQLIRMIGRFTSLAPFNALLLDAQRPGCRHVLPAHGWQEDFHRRVKPGERPQIILRTFGPVLLVFDVSQVEPIDESAPALPRSITDPFGMPPIAGVDHVLQTTVDAVKADGVRVTFTQDGASLAGSARTAWSSGTMTVKRSARARAVDVPVVVDIEINSSLDPTAAYITLAHELGHVYCGHLGSRNPDMWPDRRNLDEASEECEAEAVAYIAGLRIDPDVRMPPHLAGYLEKGDPVPPIDLDIVTKAAGLIINLHESPSQTWRRRSERTAKAGRKGGGGG